MPYGDLQPSRAKGSPIKERRGLYLEGVRSALGSFKAPLDVPRFDDESRADLTPLLFSPLHMPSPMIMSHFRFMRYGGILMREEKGSALGSLAMTPEQRGQVSS